MDNSKILEIVKTFSRYDHNSFLKFLNSPWFNSDPLVISLYNSCMEGLHNGSLSRQRLYRQVTGKKYNDKHMRYLLSSLTQCLENYLACKMFFTDETLLAQLRLKSLAARDAEKAYDYEHGILLKKLNQKKEGDTSWYLQRFLNAYQHLNYTYRKSKRKNIIRFDEVMLELDRYYIAKKLQLFAEIANARNVLASDYKMHLAEEIKKLAGHADFNGTPVIAIYYHVLMTLTGSEAEGNFRSLRQLLSAHGNIFPVEELNDLYQYVRNFCIKKINLGEDAYRQILFEIYKEILSNKKLLKHEYLSQWEFKNITTLGLRLGHSRWVESFIRKYNYFLRPAERRNAVIYNTANWHFHNRDFSSTLRLFQKVEFTDVYYQLDTRSIQLKTYYELGEEEMIYSHAAAFKAFLTRNKLIAPYQRTNYKNLVNMVLRLVRAGADKQKLKKLDAMLTATPQVADASWVRSKVEELM